MSGYEAEGAQEGEGGGGIVHIFGYVLFGNRRCRYIFIVEEENVSRP